MPVQFEIEAIVNITNRGHVVFARHLTPGQNFFVTDKSFLGGIELIKYLEIPRATNEKSEQRYDLFCFHIKNSGDISKLKEKEIVELIPGNTLHCLEPWYFTDTDLATQLHREINQNHILYGKGVKTIARRQDNDDVLFEVEDADFKFARVHLTWAQKTLTESHFPNTKTYKDWKDVYENRIIIDNKDWS